MSETIDMEVKEEKVESKKEEKKSTKKVEVKKEEKVAEAPVETHDVAANEVTPVEVKKEEKVAEPIEVKKEEKKQENKDEKIVEPTVSIQENQSVKLKRIISIYRGPKTSLSFAKFGGTLIIIDNMDNSEFAKVKFVRSGMGTAIGYALKKDLI